LKTPITPREQHTLPVPDADALAHSEACAAMLRAEIAASGGWISFARFMERVLYAPGLGYYAAGARKFGAAGDFVTAPEISALFGQSLAVTVADVLGQTGGNVLELGPGSGKLAKDVLLALDESGILPERYQLLEVSADLRERQQQALSCLPTHLRDRLEWLETLPAHFTGIIVANEVLDVIPVHLVRWTGGWVFERGVAVKDDQFVWQDVPALPQELAVPVARIQADYLAGNPPDGFLTEVAPAVGGLTTSLAQVLTRGAMILIDYGFRGAEFYHPSRATGTLMCHYRHFAHAEPFFHPGLQDITAHVDFTAVAEAGIAAGLQLAGYATQANFLLASGLPELLARIDPRDTARYLPLTNQVQRLVSPAEMGEFFKVIGFTRGDVTIPALAKARPLPI
jgi:SAM-dependent MidA family methyltransferase